MPASPTPDAEFLALQEALLGRYSIERELGRGGMGVVYLAQDVGLDRPVALKLLPVALAAGPTLRERFLREARTAAKLSHPNIVPIHAVEELGDFVFFVMSFVEGQTLGERVRERGPVDPREATRILREVAWALAYAHAQGVVHRDIKPDNILIEAGSGRAMVTDFGIARAGTAAGLPNVDGIMGTPEYMSPEQAGGEAVDGRSDLYALGVVGYYMVSGMLPFQGPTPQATLAKQLTQAAPPVASVAPEVPGGLAGALDRCLQKDPAARIQDGGELADVLGRVLRDRREVPVAIRVFREQNRESTGALAGMSMLLVMMVTMVYMVVGVGGEPLSDLLPGLVMMGLLWLFPPALLGLIARRLLKAGYGHDELVRALRHDIDDRRREIASQAGRETALDVWAPRAGWLGILLFGAGILGLPLPWVPVPLIEALLVAGMPLALLGGGTAAIRGSIRKAVPGSRWLAFWDSFIGKGIFTAAGLGLERGGAAGGAYRPTELAIGMAAERLFEELPKGVKKSLGDIPAVLRQLEGHAERMRARVEDLDRVLADAGSDPVAGEVRRTRDAAEERLHQVVAALERLRLELLRLHAGSGDVATMTMDLAAARALAEDVGHRAEGQREVNEALGLPSGLPDPADTPQPA
jgi:serine/threonine-protein kinase